MFVRRMGGMLGLGLCIAGAAAAQNLKVERPEKDRPVLRRTASRALPEKLREARRAESTPATFEAEVMFASEPPAPSQESRDNRLTPALSLRVTAARTSFLTEARIPIGELWSGRLRFSGVQQRFHSANLYSALDPASAEQVTVAPGVTSIVARSRVNYGIGLQFHFGR